MIATLFPSPTLLSVFEDLRRSLLDTIGMSRNAKLKAVAAKTSRDVGTEIAKALGRVSIKAVVPLVIRDAIERRRAATLANAEAADTRFEEPLAIVSVEDRPLLPLISDEMYWTRATQPIVEAQASADAAFKLHAEASAHIDAATYALEGLLGDLKSVMPGIKVRSAKLHKVDFRANREAAASAAAEAQQSAPVRAIRAA